MTQESLISPGQEYDSLRDELAQSKKYVFERPLVIVVVGLGFMTAKVGTYSAILPPVLVALLIFNFWFTVNRLMSAARIVAYIHVVLEKNAKWEGWETSLRKYRIWLKKDKLKAKGIVEDELEKVSSAIPDSLMYYPPIYQLHIVLVFVSLTASITWATKSSNLIAIFALLVLLLLVVIFIHYCLKWKPRKMRSLIERNIIIWSYALGHKSVDEIE